MKLDDIKTIGIVGAGQMGRGISQVCAACGYRVLLVDVSEPAVEEAFKKIRSGVERALDRGSLSSHQAGQVLALIHPMVQLDRLLEAQLVIEAIPEDLALKEDLFVQLDRICQPGTILASNTSSISITKLGAASGRPDRVIGMHFMNPAPVMQLVEVVRGLETSEHTMNLVLDLVRKLGKVSVVCKDVPGFIVNRVLLPMINEAIYTLYEGVGGVTDIDTAMKLGANHPMGPLELADFIGLDTCLSVMQVLYEGLADSKYRPCPLLVKYVEAGWLGRKANRGFYDYHGEKPVPTR